MALGYDGSIRIDSRIDEKGFNAGIRSMTASLKKLAVAVGAVFGLRAITQFGRTAVKEASDLAAAMTGLNSVVTGTGKSFDEAKRFIEDYISDGLVPATNAINAYKNLALRGYDTSQIEKTLIALKDSAAFGRQASLTLGDAVQSATEGLKNENSILVDNAGVTKNVAKMWDDFAKSIGTTTAHLTKEQKILAEVEGILEETKFQTGDAARYAENFAGQVSRLSAAWLNFRVSVGNAIIPLVTKVLPYLNSAIEALTIYFNKVSQIMSILLGVDIGGGVADLADNTQAAADAQENLADATEAAGKAAKGSLAAFDELNVLQQPEGASETPEAAASESTQAASSQADNALEELKAKVEAFKASMLEFFQPVTDAFGRLQEALAPLGKTLWEGLKWAWDNILEPLGEWAVTDALPAFLELLGAGAEVLNEALIALKPLGQWLWEEFLKPAGEWVGEQLLKALGWLTDRLKDLGKWINEHQEAFQNIILFFGTMAVTILVFIGVLKLVVGVILAVKTAIALFSAVLTFLAANPIVLVIAAIIALIAVIVLLIRNWDWVKETAAKVWQSIVDKWNQLGNNFKKNVSEPIKETFSGMWSDIKQWAADTWQSVVNKWEGAKDWFKEKVTDPVKGFFSNAWESAKTNAGETWQSIKDTWNAAGQWFTDHVTEPVKTAFRTALDWVGEKWETVFGGLGEFVKGSINTIIDLVNGMILAVAEGINAVIDNLNSISVTIPDWVPGLGGQTWGLWLPYVYAPQIPHLATGAVIPPNSEFMAVLGDQRSGRNIEAPESLIRQIISEEIGRIEAQIDIRFTGSLAALARELKPQIDKENVRVGGSLIKGGATI